MRSTLLYFFIALILVTLGACQQPIIEDPVPVVGPVPKEGLTPMERYIEARDLLQVGKEEEARVELERSLDELPADKNPRAQNLMEQITNDPVEMLGSKYFRYEIVEGESLSLIAKNYLGDPLKFYVLARYNDLDNPSLVKAGDVIKVPGEKPVVAPDPPIAIKPPSDPEPEVPAPTPPETVLGPPPEQENAEVTDLLADAGEMVDAGSYEGAINHLKKGLAEFPDSKAIKDRLADVYVELGEKHSGEGKYAEAQSALQQAADLNPENENISARLAEADRAVEADDMVLEGIKSFKSGALIDAFASFEAAKKIWPDHDRARNELANIRPEVADFYFREGLTALEGQDLEVAVVMFDKTLEVDPRHEGADRKRKYALDLLDRFKTIPDAGEQNATTN